MKAVASETLAWRTRDAAAELARAAGAELVEIGSEYGHDAFLKESAQVSRWLHRVLAGRREGRMRRWTRAA